MASLQIQSSSLVRHQLKKNLLENYIAKYPLANISLRHNYDLSHVISSILRTCMILLSKLCLTYSDINLFNIISFRPSKIIKTSLSVCLCLSVCLSVSLSLPLSFSLLAFSLCLSLSLSFFLSFSLFLPLSLFLSLCLSISLSVSLSIYLFITRLISLLVHSKYFSLPCVLLAALKLSNNALE